MNPHIATLPAEVRQVACALLPKSILLCSWQQPNIVPSSARKPSEETGRTRLNAIIDNKPCRHFASNSLKTLSSALSHTFVKASSESFNQASRSVSPDS